MSLIIIIILIPILIIETMLAGKKAEKILGDAMDKDAMMKAAEEQSNQKDTPCMSTY